MSEEQERADGARSVAQALDDAAAALQAALDAASAAHAQYVRVAGADRSWRRLQETVTEEVRQRRTEVALFAAGPLADLLRSQADDARTRFPHAGEGGEVLAPLPASEEPAQVSAWWSGLDARERALVLHRATAWAGRADGLPMAVRHAANLRVLDAEIEARRGALGADASVGAGVTDEPGGDDTEAHDLRGLLLLRSVLRGDAPGTGAEGKSEGDDGIATPRSERFLYLLDARRHPLRAAVVLGDLDDATHVVVQVPGATTRVDHRLVRELTWMSALRAEMTRMLPDDARVAVVDWIGYRAPADIAVRRPLGSSGMRVLVPGEASDERYAADAAPDLARALDGVRVLRPHARLAASGHSYGASALGLALRRTDACDVVLAAGCPGLFASSLGELGLAPGQLYVATAPGDVVAVLGIFGGDAHKIPGVLRVSPVARRVTWPDGGWSLLRPPVGHESYYSPGTTTLHHLAAAAAGLTERVRTQRS